ncbi:hypothetical protein BDR26DRAFT_866690 [Obelidium mucronatum]|nr:hypothetical protein BDR26DRAFT_866690 [Obelidium mucronatum]
MFAQPNILMFTPVESLKYPEAHNVFESLVSFVSSQEGSRQMSGLVLDCKNVEYIDYTGLQMLLCVKDFLAEHTGYHVPLHFHNPRPQHTNRLVRVNSYDPFNVDSVEGSPMLSARSPSNNPSLQSGGSPTLESLPSPTDASSSMRASRSDSLSQSTRRPYPLLVVKESQASIQYLQPSEDALVPPSLILHRTRSNSTAAPINGSNTPSLRSKTSASTMASTTSSSTSAAPAVLSSITTEKSNRSNNGSTLGYFLKKLRVAPPPSQKHGDSDSEYSEDDDDFDPFKGASSQGDAEAPGFQSIYAKELKRFKRREAAIAAGRRI